MCDILIEVKEFDSIGGIMKTVLLAAVIAGALMAAAVQIFDGGYTIYRRATDHAIVRVEDSNGHLVKVSPEAAKKLTGETIWVAPDFK